MRIFHNFLSAALLAAAISPSAAEPENPTTTDGRKIEVTFAPTVHRQAAAIAYFRDLESALNHFFRPGRNAKAVQLFVDSRQPPGTLQCRKSGNGFLLTVPADPENWRNDFYFQRRLIDHLLLPRLGRTPMATEPVLPGWIAAGIIGRARIRENSPSLMRRSRYLPGVRLLISEDAFPSWQSLAALKAEKLDPAGFRLASDVCRFVLELISANTPNSATPLADFVALLADGTPEPEARRKTLETLLQKCATILLGGSESELFQMIPPERRIDFLIRHFAEIAAFNQRVPYPAGLALRRLESFRKMAIPGSGGAGERSGDVVELPELLAADEKFQILLLQKQLEFKRIADGLPPMESRQVTAALLAVGRSRPARERQALETALQKLTSTLQRQLALESFVTAVEERSFPATLRWREELQEAARPETPPSEALHRFLLETEKRYLSE